MEEMTRLVSSGDCVKVWDSGSMLLQQQFQPHSGPVSQVCWSNNNQYVVSSSSLGDKLVVTNLKSSVQPALELAQGMKQTRVSLSSTSQFLVSGGLDNSVNIWDLKTKRLHRSLKEEHREEVTCVTFNSTDSYIASGSSSGDIIMHSVTTNLSSKAFGHGTSQPIHALAYSMVRRSILGSVSSSGAVVLWDSHTQKQLHMFDGSHKAPASGLVFSPTNDLLFVTVGLDKKIICYDTSSKAVLRTVRVESPLTAVDFSPDGTGLAVGSTQGRLYLYDLRNLSSPTRSAPAHNTSVTCLRFQSCPRGHSKSSKVASSKPSSSLPSKKLPGRLPTALPSTTTPSTIPAPSLVLEGLANERMAGLEGFANDRFAGMEGLANVGRNSMDIFSPVRDDYKVHGKSADTPGGIGGNGSGNGVFFREAEGQQSPERISRAPRNSLDIFSPVNTGGSGDAVFSREAEGQQSPERISRAPRNSLDIFSPVNTETDLEVQSSYSGGPPHRRTPLGTTGRGRCYSPLSTFQTPPPITEEGPSPTTHPQDLTWDKNSAPLVEAQGAGQTTLSSRSQPAPLFTLEPSLRGANDVPSQMRYDTPGHGASPTQTQGATAATAASLSERIAERVNAERVNGGGGGAPLTALQIDFIRNMIHETLEDARDACHRDIVNLQVEMVRQFYIQLNEIHGLIEKYSVNDSLVEEIQKLREENKRLRANY